GYTLWDAATGRPRERRELTTKWGIGIPSPNGRWVVTGGPRKGTLSVWDVETGKRVGDPLAFEPRQPGRGVPAPSSIRPVVFSPDGKLLAAVGMAVPDHRVRVWDAATGRQLFAEDLAFDSMFSDELVFSPDGKHLLASFGTSRGGTFCWDISAGKRLWQVTEFSPSSMVVTADGKILSPVPGREALDLATGEPLKDVALPPMKLGDRLTITPDGRTLFVDAKEGVTAWDLARGKVLHTWKGMRGELIPSPDGKTLLVHDGAFRRWDLTTGKPLDPDTFDDGHTREVVAVAFAAGGKWLASASKDGSVRLWHDPRTGKPFRTWRAHEPWAWHRVSMGEPCGLGATALDITPDGRFVASGGADGLKVWDAAGGKLVRSIPLPEKKHWEIDPHVMRARLAPGGESAVAVFGAESAGFAVGPGDDLNALPTLTNTIARRDVKTGAMLGQHTIAPAPTPERDLSPDGRLLLSRGVIIDTVTGKEVSRLRSTDGTGGTSAPRPLPSIFSPDGMSIAGELYEVKDNASRRAGLHVWEAATGKVVARVGTHKRSRYPTNQVALHPLLPLAATSTSFDELSVWDLRTGEIVGTLRMPEETHGGASCLAFSPDGKLLATGHPDGTILLWPVPLPQRKPEPLAKDELESLWADLRDADAARAWRAVWRMAEVPGDAIPFLRERLKPVQPVAEKVTRPLVADLGSDSFRRREAAAKRLCELGARAEPALREVLKGNPPAEVRQRVEALLRAVTEAPTALTPEELRAAGGRGAGPDRGTRGRGDPEGAGGGAAVSAGDVGGEGGGREPGGRERLAHRPYHSGYSGGRGSRRASLGGRRSCGALRRFLAEPPRLGGSLALPGAIARSSPAVAPPSPAG
ncbi:MAG TPA: PQQ-binding-like beta-propeller repeat protein, partial [Gemmataceae bacterium]